MKKRYGPPGSGWNRAAGIAMISIGLLHLAALAPHPYWADWLRGDLWWGGGDEPAALTAFWALPGSFALPLVLLGVLVVRQAGRGVVPAFLGWTLLGWILVCLLLISPASGFSLGVLPAVLLVIGGLRSRTARVPASRTEADALIADRSS